MRTSSKRTDAQATIRDVAAKAGVSVATVSRVFNDKHLVRDATYRRVRAVAERLRYVPHAGARSLSLRATNTIGVVLPDLHGEFFSEVIRGIDLAARQSGYHLLVSGSHSDRADMQAVLQAVRGRVDGLIVMSPDLDAAALVGDLPSAIPVVILNASIEGRRSVTIDNAGGARAMVRHLVALGHRRISFICGPAQNADAAERRRGYRDAARALEVDLSRDLMIAGNFTEESGYEAARRILTFATPPSAVFAANDAMAIGALSAFRAAGLRVPEDVAVVGFDDVPIARFLTPPLTTVKVPISELGRRGFEILLGSAPGQPIRPSKLETSLIVRQSCGALLRTEARRSRFNQYQQEEQA